MFSSEKRAKTGLFGESVAFLAFLWLSGSKSEII